MLSHRCTLKPADWCRILGGPILVVLALAALMHGAARWPGGPAPRPTLDMDRTILIHQIESSRTAPDADILFLGDSSCMMNIHTVDLERHTGRSCLSLATISYLDLPDHRRLLQSYLDHHDRLPGAVLLFMHPDALRRSDADPMVRRFFEHQLRDRPAPVSARLLDRLHVYLGLSWLRDYVLARAIPTPLPHAFGHRYGFTHHLDRVMTQWQGSLLDPSHRPAAGSGEYWLHSSKEQASQSFRQDWPTAVPLWIGIAPLPQDFVGADYPREYQAMLQTWGDWLEADLVLTNLPAVLPPSLFATKTHLNPEGNRVYTALVAEEIVARRAALKLDRFPSSEARLPAAAGSHPTQPLACISHQKKAGEKCRLGKIPWQL